MNVIGDAHGVSKMSVSLLTCKHTISTVIMNLKLTRVDTKIGLACSMLYYIYLCKYVLIFISDNGIKGWLSTHRTGLSLHFLNVPVLSEEPFTRVFVCLFLTFVFFCQNEVFPWIFSSGFGVFTFIFALSRGTCRSPCSMGICPLLKTVGRSLYETLYFCGSLSNGNLFHISIFFIWKTRSRSNCICKTDW